MKPIENLTWDEWSQLFYDTLKAVATGSVGDVERSRLAGMSLRSVAALHDAQVQRELDRLRYAPPSPVFFPVESAKP